MISDYMVGTPVTSSNHRGHCAAQLYGGTRLLFLANFAAAIGCSALAPDGDRYPDHPLHSLSHSDDDSSAGGGNGDASLEVEFVVEAYDELPPGFSVVLRNQHHEHVWSCSAQQVDGCAHATVNRESVRSVEVLFYSRSGSFERATALLDLDTDVERVIVRILLAEEQPNRFYWIRKWFVVYQRSSGAASHNAALDVTLQPAHSDEAMLLRQYQLTNGDMYNYVLCGRSGRFGRFEVREGGGWLIIHPQHSFSDCSWPSIADRWLDRLETILVPSDTASAVGQRVTLNREPPRQGQYRYIIHLFRVLRVGTVVGYRGRRGDVAEPFVFERITLTDEFVPATFGAEP